MDGEIPFMKYETNPPWPMKTAALILVSALAILSLVVIAFDAFPPLVRAWMRRRRRARSGTYGVVLDGRGRVLGTYLDPFALEKRGARVHREAPWATPGLDGESGWAWEGFGPTQEEARLAAERLRRRYLHLLPWLEEEVEDEEWRG
jgi:hypothetical protein